MEASGGRRWAGAGGDAVAGECGEEEEQEEQGHQHKLQYDISTMDDVIGSERLTWMSSFRIKYIDGQTIIFQCTTL